MPNPFNVQAPCHPLLFLRPFQVVLKGEAGGGPRIDAAPVRNVKLHNSSSSLIVQLNYELLVDWRGVSQVVRRFVVLDEFSNAVYGVDIVWLVKAIAP